MKWMCIKANNGHTLADAAPLQTATPGGKWWLNCVDEEGRLRDTHLTFRNTRNRWRVYDDPEGHGPYTPATCVMGPFNTLEEVEIHLTIKHATGQLEV